MRSGKLTYSKQGEGAIPTEQFLISSPIGHLKICVRQNRLSSISKAKPAEIKAWQQRQSQVVPSAKTRRPALVQASKTGPANTLTDSVKAEPSDLKAGHAASALTNSAKAEPLNSYSKKLSSFALSVQRQLEDYFQKKRKNFSLPLEPPNGTPFQNKLWRALHSIPYGQTKSYGEVARQLNKPKGARAVGQACANNPLLIVTPCHRVVSKKNPKKNPKKDRKKHIGGFALGLKAKKHLLELEQSK